jgi:retinol-binding protein 3
MLNISHGHVRRIVFAALVASASACGVSAPNVSGTDQAKIIDGVVARIRELYIAPEDIETIEAGLRSNTSKYRSAATAEELAEQLGADLRQLSGDPHFRMMYFAAGVPPLPTGIRSPVESESERTARYDMAAARSNNGFARAERLDGNVGYIEVTGVPEPAILKHTAAAAMTFVSHTSALILDLRRNRGGDPAGVGYLMSYFLPGRVHVYDMVSRKPENSLQVFTEADVPGPRYAANKPLFVLTSKDTYSGGEALADGMKTFTNARLVGEATKGGANAALPAKVNDHFVVGVPFMKTVNMKTGRNWSGTGVQPHVSVPASQSQDVAYRLALEQIVATTSNPSQRQQTQQLLDTLKAKRAESAEQ